MSGRPQDDRNQEATVYLGNLDERCSDALVWELMLQAGPVVNVHLPKDRISMTHQGYGFCEFLTEEDAEYACKIMNQIKLWGKPIRVNKASSDKKQLDVGANLFIGNLDENVDERLLYDTFSAFGMMATTAKIARDPQNGISKGYGFVSYTDFEASDAALESMNGQFLMNKPIQVQYAFKKDGKGERHGTDAERKLAAQARKNNALPVSARPPPAPAAFGARPPMPGQPGFPPQAPAPYQPGQFAGALAQPPPPPGFTPQQTIMPGMAPPMGVPPMGGPPMGMPMMNPMMGQPGMPGVPPMGMPGMPGMMPPPPPNMQMYPGAGFPPPPPPGFGQPPMPGMGPPSSIPYR
jgi:splicing factor 3B subunit 4